MSPYHLRRLTPEDAVLFKTIRLECLYNHPECFGSSFEDEQHRTISQFAERIRQNTIWAAFDDQRNIMGTVGIALGKTDKTRHNALIWGMYVRPEARHSGLSRQLITQAIAEVKDVCRSIRLSVVATNTPAIRLYTAAGFRTWAVDSEALKVGEVYYDELLMRYDTLPATAPSNTL